MTISKELLLAILSMDSYNQGYGKGLETGTTTIGSATLQNITLPNGSVAAGFYAAAYDTPYGKVISYRGTDNYLLSNPTTGGNDIINGWISALGTTSGQTDMALQFYNTVTHSTYQAGAQSNVTLTGHSLDYGDTPLN
jgi:hypothetical protein